MAFITYRQSTNPTLPGVTTSKGTPLTNLEVDANFKAINDELSLKALSISPTFTGAVILPANTVIGTVTATELTYLSGVTSAIQTQINSKASTTFVTTTASDAALSMAIALG